MKQLHVKHQLKVNPDDPAGENLHVYNVTKVVNAIRPTIGSELSDEELDYYCVSEDWSVAVT